MGEDPVEPHLSLTIHPMLTTPAPVTLQLSVLWIRVLDKVPFEARFLLLEKISPSGALASEISGYALGSCPCLRNEGPSGPAQPLVWASQLLALEAPDLVFVRLIPCLWPQVVMKVVQLLPDGHRVKREVDAALDTVSETMTPMHYHLREIIICTFRQVSPGPRAVPACTAQEGADLGVRWLGPPTGPSGALSPFSTSWKSR